MKPLPLIETLIETIKPIVTMGNSVNVATRQNIINTTGELADELIRVTYLSHPCPDQHNCQT